MIHTFIRIALVETASYYRTQCRSAAHRREPPAWPTNWQLKQKSEPNSKWKVKGDSPYRGDYQSKRCEEGGRGAEQKLGLEAKVKEDGLYQGDRHLTKHAISKGDQSSGHRIGDRSSGSEMRSRAEEKVKGDQSSGHRIGDRSSGSDKPPRVQEKVKDDQMSGTVSATESLFPHAITSGRPR